MTMPAIFSCFVIDWSVAYSMIFTSFYLDAWTWFQRGLTRVSWLLIAIEDRRKCWIHFEFSRNGGGDWNPQETPLRRSYETCGAFVCCAFSHA